MVRDPCERMRGDPSGPPRPVGRSAWDARAGARRRRGRPRRHGRAALGSFPPLVWRVEPALQAPEEPVPSVEVVQPALDELVGDSSPRSSRSRSAAGLRRRRRQNLTPVAARSRSCPRRRASGCGRTSRSRPRSRSRPPRAGARHSLRREPGERHRRLARSAPRTESVERPRAPRPSRRARRSRARARASGRASPRCRPCSGAKTSKTKRPPGHEQPVGGGERRAPVARRPARWRSERNGQMTSGTALVDRRVAEVAEPEVEEVRDAGEPRRAAGRPRASRATSRRRSRDARRRRSGPRSGRCRRRARRPAPPRLARLLDVEADVLGDAAAPRVVELGDRVVGAVTEHDDTLARWTPRRLESEARSAIAGASTLDELDDARVRYLGPQERAEAGAARGARPRDRAAR